MSIFEVIRAVMQGNNPRWALMELVPGQEDGGLYPLDDDLDNIDDNGDDEYSDEEDDDDEEIDDGDEEIEDENQDDDGESENAVDSDEY